MPIELLPTLLLYMCTIGYLPGPANIFSLGIALRHGRRPALKVWYGLFTGFSIITFGIALLSYHFGDTLSHYVQWIRYIGAAYILWLAYGILRSAARKAPEGEIAGENAAVAADRSCTFLSGMIVQLTNAKMIIFIFTLFGIFVIPNSQELHHYLLFSVCTYIAGPVANLTWLAAGVYLRKVFTGRHRRRADIVMAIALGLCAVLILL